MSFKCGCCRVLSKLHGCVLATSARPMTGWRSTLWWLSERLCQALPCHYYALIVLSEKLETNPLVHSFDCRRSLTTTQSSGSIGDECPGCMQRDGQIGRPAALPVPWVRLAGEHAPLSDQPSRPGWPTVGADGWLTGELMGEQRLPASVVSMVYVHMLSSMCKPLLTWMDYLSTSRQHP